MGGHGRAEKVKAFSGQVTSLAGYGEPMLEGTGQGAASSSGPGLSLNGSMPLPWLLLRGGCGDSGEPPHSTERSPGALGLDQDENRKVGLVECLPGIWEAVPAASVSNLGGRARMEQWAEIQEAAAGSKSEVLADACSLAGPFLLSSGMAQGPPRPPSHTPYN